jgi:hypothetical protein
MEILRVPHTVPQTEVTVSLASTEYEYQIIDLVDGSVRTDSGFSDANKKLIVDFPTRYDASYQVVVDNQELEFDVVRPYVDASVMADSTADIATYKKNEEIARAIIDSVISEGFYYRKKVLNKVGMGTDYLPLWDDAKKLLKLYENNVLIFDAENPSSYNPKYKISGDKTAIVMDTEEFEYNLAEQKPNILPQAESDLLDMTYGYHGFPQGFDYTAIIEVGHHEVPSDIVRATELLVDDIACGRMEYFMRHVTEYNTDQFKMKFASEAFEGTGNIIVDKILSKYYKSIRSIGVL